MKFYNYYIVIYLFLSSLLSQDFSFHNIPIQENGRIKPLDTFSRNHLLSIYTKRSLNHSSLPENYEIKKMAAIDWLLDVMIYPNDADKYKVFNIRNPEVVGSLGLEWNPKHLYSRTEILKGLQNQLEYLEKIQSVSDEDHTPFDRDMLNLYRNVIRFQDLCFSFSCLLPVITIQNENLAKIMEIIPGGKVSYYDIMNKAESINPLIERLVQKSDKNLSDFDIELSKILMTLNDINQDNFSQILKIIPPENNKSDENWIAPWQLMDGRKIGDNQREILNSLSNYIYAKLDRDKILEQKALETYSSILEKSKNIINIKNLKIESWYNEANLFVKSILFYILAFFLLIISWMIKPVLCRKIAFFSLLAGLAVHFFGILLRIIIMLRPPVSTLYESIIFVSFIGVVCAAILEKNRKDGVGIFVGSICGIALHFVGFGYANDGDTLGMLVAVLNSNFWLATHVTTITTGYGTSLFAGLLGHIYLLQSIINPTNKNYLKTINSNMFGATLFALFFTLFGTILGGIWADQSWGRFWGWDPKENGALLIVMWQIMMIHMRITGYVKPLGFALGMIINNIVVILAWFGVNLLSVGLHSYGFASGIAKNITIFISIELIFGFCAYYLAKRRKIISLKS